MVSSKNKTANTVKEPVIIRFFSRTKLPQLPYIEYVQVVLGTSYELSLVVAGETRMKNYNRDLRNKDASTDVLSFPLTKTSGELFVCPIKLKQKARLFNLSYTEYTKKAFIHSLLHLKGYTHGSTMEKEEQRFLKRLSS